MSLRFSYTLIAPFYDFLIRPAFDRIRAKSLKQLPHGGSQRILINGIGTGLDLPFLPRQHHYVGLDLTAAMLARAKTRKGKLDLSLVQGDSLSLPFPSASFDHVVLHLILAVVPDPAQCLSEAARVLRPGGSIIVLDKFLRPGQAAPLRRMLNPLSRRMATRMDVIFEEVLLATPQLRVEGDQPILAKGWFRSIRLQKT